MPNKEEVQLFPESRVKEYLKGKEIRISSEAIPALDILVKRLLVSAAARAKANNRSTVKPEDL